MTKLKSSALAPGQERFNMFRPARLGLKKRLPFVQYDYRASDGELFTCTAPSLRMARQKRDLWQIGRKLQGG